MREKEVFEAMEGAVIKQLFVDATYEEFLLFVAEDGRMFGWQVEGDCCSQSWFADVTGVSALIGKAITKVEEVGMPEGYNVDDGRCRQEEDAVYGYRITTLGGYVDIVHRNSSNGYYGGWMTPTVLDADPGRKDLVEITDDWQA